MGWYGGYVLSIGLEGGFFKILNNKKKNKKKILLKKI
jgi:hypothetical protein